MACPSRRKTAPETTIDHGDGNAIAVGTGRHATPPRSPQVSGASPS